MLEPFVPRTQMRRKRRKSEGDAVLDALAKERHELERKDRGLRCRECGKWQSWDKLSAKWEMRSKDLHRLWTCLCGNVLRVDNVTDLGMAQETLENPVRFRLLVCGDRRWTDVKAVAKVLKRFDPHTTVVITGMARGADRIAHDLALRMGMQVMKFPADWDAHGKAAGPIRNKQMLVEGRPELVVAFHDDLDSSKGTVHMVKIARRAGVRVRLVRHKV